MKCEDHSWDHIVNSLRKQLREMKCDQSTLEMLQLRTKAQIEACDDESLKECFQLLLVEMIRLQEKTTG